MLQELALQEPVPLPDQDTPSLTAADAKAKTLEPLSAALASPSPNASTILWALMIETDERLLP